MQYAISTTHNDPNTGNHEVSHQSLHCNDCYKLLSLPRASETCLTHLLLLTEAHGGLVHVDLTLKRKANTWLGQYLVAQTTSMLFRECHLLLWSSNLNGVMA